MASSDDEIMFLGTSTILKQNHSKKQATTSVQEKLTVKPLSTKKDSCWVQSAFDDFFAEAQTTGGVVNAKRKRPRADVASTVKERKKCSWKKITINDELWYERHAPKNQSELAVHKKKVSEVEAWLQSSLRLTQKAPILLLTGGAGCGKTACVQCLCRQLKAEIVEWINPVTNTDKDIHDMDAVKSEYSSVGSYQTKSQLALFEDFLLRANKYPTLPIFGEGALDRKVVLVEDFPNVFFRDTAVFHTIVRRYRRSGRSPLVFVVTDSAGGESNERLLFPKSLQAELDIHNITFNPIAATMMVKVLERIVQAEKLNDSTRCGPFSKTVIEGLATACSGDIRGAINALQFACLIDTSDLARLGKVTLESSSKTASKSKTARWQTSRMKHALPCGIGGKDSSLFLFRALGKILYCKRVEENSSNAFSTVSLKPHLRHHERTPLTFQPEDVVERSCMSDEYFVDYLHQNYVDFYTTVLDVVRASDYLSMSDAITRNWASRDVMCRYASSIATRGLVHSNTSGLGLHTTDSGATRRGAFKPLHKPEWYDVRRKMRSNNDTAQDLFRMHRSSPRDLHTEFLPYLALINVRGHTGAQVSYLQQVARLNKHVVRPCAHRLDENDAGLDHEDLSSELIVSTHGAENEGDEDTTANIITQNAFDDDPEIVIEDFDD